MATNSRHIFRICPDSMNLISERASGLAFLPITTTVGFYFLPSHWQSNIFIQFIPQLSAYLALGLWSLQNVALVTKLGLERHKVGLGVKVGTGIGILLGCINATIILYLVPFMGGNISFLRDTPHAQLPFWVMVPWFILLIAVFVELNFRGFIFARLLVFSSQSLSQSEPSSPARIRLGLLLSLIISALTFSFDPFMVTTFGSLHWIAVWDGLIWGWMWIRLTNLYSVITAHAVEVLILYFAVRAALL